MRRRRSELSARERLPERLRVFREGDWPGADYMERHEAHSAALVTYCRENGISLLEVIRDRVQRTIGGTDR